MRNLNAPAFVHWRRTGPDVIAIFGSNGDDREGAFLIPQATTFAGYRAHTTLAIIASAGEGWDHVSVSGKNRTPNWGEMALVHRLFFEKDEIALQYMVPSDKHINVHPHVLHLWRPWNTPITLPPTFLV